MRRTPVLLPLLLLVGMPLSGMAQEPPRQSPAPEAVAPVPAAESAPAQPPALNAELKAKTVGAPMRCPDCFSAQVEGQQASRPRRPPLWAAA